MPFPPPRDLPSPRFQPASPALAGRFFTTEPSGSPIRYIIDEEMQLHSFVGVFVFGHVFCGILVPRPGIEPPPLALAARSQPLDCRGSPGNYIDRVCLPQSSKPWCSYDPAPIAALEEAQGGSCVQEGRPSLCNTAAVRSFE